MNNYIYKEVMLNRHTIKKIEKKPYLSDPHLFYHLESPVKIMSIL
jgi:hypothetical protein